MLSSSRTTDFGNRSIGLTTGPDISIPILVESNSDPCCSFFKFEEDNSVVAEDKNNYWDAFDFEDQFLEEKTISEKSFSMLEPEVSRHNGTLLSKNVMRFPPADVEDDEDECDEDLLSDCNISKIKTKSDKAVQTENEFRSSWNEKASQEGAAFIESTIRLTNIVSNCSKNSKRKKLIDCLKDYTPIPTSEITVERCKSFDAIAANLGSHTWDSFREEVEKFFQNILKRLRKSDKTIKRNETEVIWRNGSYFDFESDSFEGSLSSAKKNKKAAYVYEEETLGKSLETFLTWIENTINRESMYLRIVWKNSQIENGMKLLDQILECDLETIHVRARISQFFKRILDSFSNDISTYQNSELEFKASFVTVTCLCPCLCLDLIQYCVDKLLFSNRHIQSSGNGKKKTSSILFVEGHFVLYRLLRDLLEKLSNDLKSNMVEFSSVEGCNKNPDPKNAWKISDFEKKKESEKNENFATVLERLLRGLNDLVSFSKTRFPLTTLIVSECLELVRDIHRTTLNFCELPVKDKKNLDFYSCTF